MLDAPSPDKCVKVFKTLDIGVDLEQAQGVVGVTG